MKTGLLVVILSALVLYCGCGKSGNRMSKYEMKQKIIEKYSRYIPEQHIRKELEGTLDNSDRTSMMLYLQERNGLEIYDAFLRDVRRYQSAR